MSWLKSLFAPAAPIRRPARLGLEPLADRLNPSQLFLSAGGTLWIDGSAGPDSATLTQAANGAVTLSVSFDGGAAQTQTYAANQVTAVRFDGYQGNDTVVNVTNVPLTAFGGPGNDVLRGGYAGDSLSGGDGDDYLRGYTGGDWMDGGAGTDLLVGDEGDDRLHGGDGDDRLEGGAGDDVLGAKFRQTDSATTSYSENNVYYTETTYTYEGATEAGSDRLFGGEGDDVLRGGSGTDWLFGGNGNDTLGADVVQTSDKRDGAGFANEYTFVALGEDGADFLYGEAGNDTLRGGNGNDFVSGGAGDDTLGAESKTVGTAVWVPLTADVGEDGDDILRGGDGNDTLRGGVGADELHGDAGRDKLYAGWTASVGGGARHDGSVDKVYGGADNDMFFGMETQDQSDWVFGEWYS